MRIRFRDRAAFVPADLAESSAELSNPGCGWYHVYTFQAQPPADGRPVDGEVWLDGRCRQERLALVLIDIGAFWTAPLSGEALEHIGRILAFFRRNGMQMLLRFAYDTQGKGMEREPPTLAGVKGHMEQIGGVIGPYLEDILVMQGIFVGDWGEMHGSRFLDDASMCGLVDTLYRVTQGRCFLAVRTPAQWRRVAGNPQTRPEVVKRLALFNDGIFGSPTDLGTYSVQTRAEAGETAPWSREEELEWQRRHLGRTPNGGEILSCLPLKGFREAERDLRAMHAGYLNSVYHPEQLDHWGGETVEGPGCWRGLSGYDYIGRHLGFRFSVVKAEEVRGNSLRITIKNSGFGNLCQEADCFLAVEAGPDRVSLRRLDTDPRQWDSGQETVLPAPVPREGRGAGSKLYLLLKRRSDGCALRFANQGEDGKTYLGQFL